MGALVRRRGLLQFEPSEGMRLLDLALSKWTQRALAKHLGYSHGIVSMWLTGTRTPAYSARVVLERVLGIALGSWDVPPDAARTCEQPRLQVQDVATNPPPRAA